MRFICALPSVRREINVLTRRLISHEAFLSNRRQFGSHSVAAHTPSPDQAGTATASSIDLPLEGAAARKDHTAHTRGTHWGARDYGQGLRQRLRASGSPPLQLRRVNDPLVRHLFRVAGNATYRSSSQSVLVSGASLVTELRKFFRCKRLVKSFDRRAGASERHAGPPRELVAPMRGSTTSPAEESRNDGSVFGLPYVETHYATGRILKKLAGLHSYDGGCVAEMTHPPQAKDLGDIRLLLCLGRPPCSFYNESTQDSSAGSSKDGCSQANYTVTGIMGTLLRSAAALQWQGVWLLPECPDVFSPFAIRAAQGALFWMPYCRGSWEELLKFTADNGLLVCVPHGRGTSIQSMEITQEQSKGICLVIDEDFYRAADDAVRHGKHVHLRSEQVSASVTTLPPAASEEAATSVTGGSRLPRCFRPDLVVSLHSGIGEKRDRLDTMAMMHPVSWTTILMYYLKQIHFPDVASSAFVFSLPKKRSNSIS